MQTVMIINSFFACLDEIEYEFDQKGPINKRSSLVQVAPRQQSGGRPPPVSNFVQGK